MNMHVRIQDVASTSKILPFPLDFRCTPLHLRIMSLHGCMSNKRLYHSLLVFLSQSFVPGTKAIFFKGCFYRTLSLGDTEEAAFVSKQNCRYEVQSSGASLPTINSVQNVFHFSPQFCLFFKLICQTFQIFSPINENQHSFIGMSHKTSLQKILLPKSLPLLIRALTDIYCHHSNSQYTQAVPPLNYCFTFAVLEIVPKALCTLGKHPSTKATSSTWLQLMSTEHLPILCT